jgi:hypothetical protein
MITSAFEGLLVPERSRRRAARDGGWALPFLSERVVGPEDGPFLVTNMRGSFLQPGVSRENVLRYGFSQCSLEEEGTFLGEFYRVLWDTSERLGWSNRCSSIAQATQKLLGFGLQPRILIVPLSNLGRICGQEVSLEDARNLILAQGCVTEVDGVRIMFSNLPDGQMLLSTAAPLVGVYARVDDYLGLVFYRANQTVQLIQDELAR